MAVQCRGIPLLCDAVLFRAETEFYNRRPDLIPAEPQEMYLNASSSFDRPGAMCFLRFRGRTGQSASFIVVAVTKRSLLTLLESRRQGLVTSSKTNPRLGDLWYLTIAPDFFNREQSRANSANPSKLVALTRALTRG